jgi:hypothetical protein
MHLFRERRNSPNPFLLNFVIFSSSFRASTRRKEKVSNVAVSRSFRIGVSDEWIDNVSEKKT